METWIIEQAQQAIIHMLIERFERRPYSRIAITSAWRADEPRLSLEVGELAECRDMLPAATPLEQCGMTVLLTAATEHEERAMHALLEVVSFLHGADVATGDIVILDCAFRAARLERDPLREQSCCQADFAITLLRD